jgi:glycosyltransferase involved in cell wall biosynthesis
MRRVCFVAPFGLGQKTTVWARTLPLAKELAAHGWPVTILVPPWDTPADAGKTWIDGGVEVVNVPIRGGIPATTLRLLRALDARAPDIVHIVKPRAHAGLVQWVLAQRRRCAPPAPAPRLVLDVDDWEQAWAPINRYRWPINSFLAWQEEWGLRHADAVTAASRWLQRRARDYAPQTPVLYLPNGITAPPRRQATSTPQPKPEGAVLFFTRFVEVRPAWLADFCTSLYARRPQMRLIIAGTPVQVGLDRPFRHAVAATKAGEAVTWLGYVAPATMPGIYAATGCAIFPAADIPLQQAKCSVRLATTLLEGVPVVASAVGEQSTYGADGAARLVAADASPAEFAAAVDAVLRNPQEQAALRMNAQTRLLEQYAWKRLAQELVAFYTKMG